MYCPRIIMTLTAQSRDQTRTPGQSGDARQTRGDVNGVCRSRLRHRWKALVLTIPMMYGSMPADGIRRL